MSRGSINKFQGGELIIIDPDKDQTSSLPTYQCVHCGLHWHPQPGSGKTRGFCMSCNGPVCGKKCEACIPHEKQLEARESGMPWHSNLPGNPVSVAFGKIFPGSSF